MSEREPNQEKTVNVIAKVEPSEIAAQDPISLMGVIAAAATNPDIDVDKFERLMNLHERLQAREAEQRFNEAMNLAQADLRPVAADASNPQTKSKYASYTALDKAVRPIYSRHGLSLSFNTGEAPKPEDIRVICDVRHRDGHKETYHLDMPADGKGAKGGDVMTKTHATGAALSYSQRYLLKLIFNIAVGDDDDGNSNGGREQTAAATAAISAINLCTSFAELKNWKAANTAGLAALPTAEADEVVRLFNSRFRKLKEGGGE